MIKFSDSIVLSSDNIDKSTQESIKKYSSDYLSFEDSSNEEALVEFLLKNIN